MTLLHIARELALFFGPIIGVIAVGQEAEGTVEETIAVERAMSFKFTATATVKVTSLSLKLGAVSGTGTSGRLALQADEGGTKPKEGVLCEGPIASVAAGEHTTTSLTAEPEVVSGTVYWLTILPLGGSAKIKCGTTTSRQKTTVNRSLISIIVAADWGGSVTKGPASIWATGTEGGVTIPLNAASSTSAATLAVTAATTIPLISASSTSGGQLALSATTQVALNAAASTSSATVALSAPTGVVLGSAASESAAGGLALQAPTGVGVLPAVSSSTASVTVSVVTQLSLASAASGSSAVAEVKTGGTPSVAASFGGTAGGSYVAAGGEGERGAVVVGAAGTVGSVIVTGGHQ